MLEKETKSREKACKASEITRLHAEELYAANIENPKGDSTSWESEHTAAQNEFMVAIDELEDAKKEIRKLKQEFQTCMETKAFDIKQVEEEITKVEINSSREKELQKEIVAAMNLMPFLNGLVCKQRRKWFQLHMRGRP